MGRGTLRNVTSRGQSAVSKTAAAVCDRGKKDFEEICRFPAITDEGELQKEVLVCWIAS